MDSAPQITVTRADREWLREIAAILRGKDASLRVRATAAQTLERLAYRADIAERRGHPVISRTESVDRA